MSSVNRVMLVGNLGTEPEVRFTDKGNAVLNFRMATSERWMGRDGQRQERTEWHRVQYWGRAVEQLGQLLYRGCKVFVEGKIETRSYQDKVTGETKYITEIRARDILVLDRRKDSRDDGGGDGYATEF